RPCAPVRNPVDWTGGRMDMVMVRATCGSVARSASGDVDSCAYASCAARTSRSLPQGCGIHREVREDRFRSRLARHIAALKSQPPGRTFLVVEQGRFSGEHVIERLLLFHDIETLQTATGLSLNTFAPIQFDGRNPLHYNLFNVRYVIAPVGFEVPWFLTPIKSTNDYTLYRADTTGYATFARIKDVPVPARTD